MTGRAFDEVFEGDELPPLEFVLSKDQVRTYAHAVHMAAGRFTDDEQARLEGLPGMITPGNMSMGLITRLLEDFAGPGSLRRLGTTFRGLLLPGRTIRLCGAITEKNDDARTIEVDCWIETDEGDRVVIGTATLQLA
jgi:acyl dehydratase